MGWKDQAIELYKRSGAPAKFAAKMVLGTVLPGSPAAVDLIGEILDCVHETAKDQLTFEERSLAGSADDLRCVEEMLAVLVEELSPLVVQVAALEKAPELAAQVLDVALATDERFRVAVRKLDALARRFGQSATLTIADLVKAARHGAKPREQSATSAENCQASNKIEDDEIEDDEIEDDLDEIEDVLDKIDIIQGASALAVFFDSRERESEEITCSDGYGMLPKKWSRCYESL